MCRVGELAKLVAAVSLSLSPKERLSWSVRTEKYHFCRQEKQLFLDNYFKIYIYRKFYYWENILCEDEHYLKEENENSVIAAFS